MLINSNSYFKMKNNKPGIYSLFLVIIVYFSQGWLFAKGSVISQTMLVLWLVIDIYYFCKIIIYSKMDAFGWILFAFLVLNFFNWFLFDKVTIGPRGEIVNTLGDLKNISAFLLSYYPFKYLTNSIEKDYYLKILFASLFIVFVFTFFANEKTVLSENKYADSITNNFAFYFVMLAPLLGLFFNKNIKYMIILVILYFVMIGAKRGAMVCYSAIFVYFIYFSTITLTKRKRVLGLLGILAIMIVIIYVTYRLYQSNDYLQNRLSLTFEGDDSGRSDIRAILLSHFKTSSIIKMIFGGGMDYTITVSGYWAHNDWVQLLLDAGLLGVFVYLLMFSYFVRYYITNRQYMTDAVRYMYLSSITCWFLKSLFSMGYTEIYSFLFFLPIVYAQCFVNKQKENILYSNHK